MADFNLGLDPAVNMWDQSLVFQPTTTIPFINPIFEGSDLITDPSVPINHVFNLGHSVEIHTPNRPGGGQLYPRGNQ